MTKFWGWASRNNGPLDIYEVLHDPTHENFLHLGRLLWSLVPVQPEWVHRKVESATLVGERRIRRHMSVDCHVPSEVTDLAGEVGFERFFVPLRFVMSQSLLNFDLVLDGQAVPLLTRSQNIMATRAMLHAAAEQCDIDDAPEVRAILAEVARADHPAEREALALLGLGPQPVDSGDEPIEQAMLRWAIRTFDRNYMLLADVPLAAVQHRTVFKVTQEFYQTISHNASGLLPVAEQVAWRPTPLIFNIPDVTSASSYHFEFIAPAGMIVDSGSLLARVEGEDVFFGTSTVLTTMGGINIHSEDVPQADSYTATLRVRPSAEGLLRASAASATISTLLLLVAAAGAHRLGDEGLGPSVTLLLVLPGLVSTFLARPGEHSLVSFMLRGIRVLTLFSALLTYVAAGLLAMGVSGAALRLSWLGLAVVSMVPAVALIGAVLSARRPYHPD